MIMEGAMQGVEAVIEYRHDATLGEGPVWDEQEARLYWVDILSGTLFQYDPQQKSNKSYDVGGHLGAAVLREKGGLVMARQSGFAFFDPESGEIDKITDPESNVPGTRFNDAKCDPAGRLWAGTLSYDLREGAGTLYCLDRGLEAKAMLQGLTIPNGMAWNKKRTTFFFIDTPSRKILSFDYDHASGDIANPSVIKELEESEGYPDGMAIDREGALWVALYDGFKVIRIDPASGETLFEVRLPVPQATSCTFGGPGFNELYITTAREHMSEEEVNRWPLSGSLFKVTLPFAGRPADRFAG